MFQMFDVFLSAKSEAVVLAQKSPKSRFWPFSGVLSHFAPHFKVQKYSFFATLPSTTAFFSQNLTE